MGTLSYVIIHRPACRNRSPDGHHYSGTCTLGPCFFFFTNSTSRPFDDPMSPHRMIQAYQRTILAGTGTRGSVLFSLAPFPTLVPTFQASRRASCDCTPGHETSLLVTQLALAKTRAASYESSDHGQRPLPSAQITSFKIHPIPARMTRHAITWNARRASLGMELKR